MPKLTNICLLLAILSLCARLSLGCTTRPTIEHSTRPTWSPCFPDCEKGFQCYQPTNQPGLAWVVKPAVFVWQLVPNYEIFHNFQFRICVPVTKREYESPNLSTKIKQTLPQWNKQGQSGSSCFPDCEKGFQCQIIGPTAGHSGLGWVSSTFLKYYLYKTSCFCLTACALLWNFSQFSIQNLCASFKERIWKLWHPDRWHHWTIRRLFYTKANTKWSSIS